MRLLAWVTLVLLVPMTAGCLDADQRRFKALLNEEQWGVQNVSVEGKVESVKWKEFDTGPMQEVVLAGRAYDSCNGILFPASPEIRVGDEVDTTLQFRPGTFNGEPAVWSAQMQCPGPGLVRAIAEVLDAVSFLSGGLFVPVGPIAGGAEYEYRPRLDEPIPLANLTLRLNGWIPTGTLDGPKQWTAAAADLFVAVSDAAKSPQALLYRLPAPAGFDVLDETRLDGPAGVHLSFEDRGRIGWLDLGDRLQVAHLGDGAYFLQLTPCVQACPVVFQAFVKAGSIDLTPSISALSLAHHEGSDFAEIEIVATHGPSVPTNDLEWSLNANGTTTGGLVGGVLGGPGGRIELIDAGTTGILDVGDRVRITGARADHARLGARSPGPNQYVISHEWAPGVGRPPADLLWSIAWEGSTGAVTATGSLELRRLDQFRLGAGLSSVVLQDGAQDSCDGGRTFTFDDVDADGYLSSGDRFHVAGEADGWCRLVLSTFGGILVSESDPDDASV